MGVGIVLYRPRMADNVGGVARAMVNFGFDRMVIADPATYHFDTRTAVKAERVVESAYIARTFEEAVAPFTWVCGTTSRFIRRRPALSPREMAEEAYRRVQAGGTACVVLGSENHGLTDADIDRCDAICRIDTTEEQPSINLAQAAAILCYELHVAQKQARPPRQKAEMASRESVDRLMDFSQQMLLDAGFLNPQQPHLILAELRRMLVRGEPTKREVELLTAAVKQVQRSLLLPQRKRD
jgi:tRNA/rRNA methyltransferase